MVHESSTRPLTTAERRLLKARIRQLEQRLGRGSKIMIPGVATIVVLWALTLALSDASSIVATVFWGVAGAAILLWVHFDTRKDLAYFREMLREHRSALARNQAQVFDIRSRAFVEFEEVEDEGACYAFEIDGPLLVFVSGQQFYPSARFPSQDFALVHVLNEAGQPIDMWIEKRGEQAPAARILPAASKMQLEIPEHLDVLSGSLDQIEELLTPGRANQ